MPRFRSIVLGVACAVTVAGLAPALASADGPHNPTCTFDSFTHLVTVHDRSDVSELTLVLDGIDIAAHNTNGATVKCFSITQQGVKATILNTDAISVIGTLVGTPTGGCATCPPQPVNDGYVVDESQGAFAPGYTLEADGQSEIEIAFETGSVNKPLLTVNGTDGTASADLIRVGGPGWINFGTDNDVDVITGFGSQRVTVNGLGGADFITGTGNSDQSTLLRAKVPLTLNGGDGSDTVIGGDGSDTLSGGNDDDYVQSVDGVKDGVSGGSGLHDVGFTDAKDTPATGFEQNDTVGVGTLQVTPRIQRATTNARLKLSWTHPKAWRALRSVDLLLFDNANRQVGMVATKSSGLKGRGAVKVMAGSRVSHHGKTVTARLALKLPRSLRGQSLRVAVRATDRHGRKQLEADAGVINVAK
jgi:RTX calcium-binding nonapeptide repeat (4 copies)